jgi:transposase-like protein
MEGWGASQKPNEVVNVRTPTCRFCRSANVVKAGWRYNRNGRKRRFLCKACGRRFTVDDGFLGMWYTKETTAEAVDLHYEGLSYRKVARHFEQHRRERPSWTSIWRWVHKFVRLAKRFVAKFVPRVSDRWHADEMFTRVGGKPSLDWEVMDSETRFWLAGRLTEGWKGTTEQAEEVLRITRERAGRRPLYLITDELAAYRKASHWALGWRHCEHKPVDWREGMGPRNLMERKIQTTRMRVKTMRCLKSLKIGQNWLDGANIHYNFIRRHMALGKTPAETAGIHLKLGRNAWLGLITMSVKILIIVYLPKMKQNPNPQPLNRDNRRLTRQKGGKK